jgi:hypothetical protein
VLLLGLPAGLPAPLGLFFNCLLTILPQVIDLVRVILYYFCLLFNCFSKISLRVLG